MEEMLQKSLKARVEDLCRLGHHKKEAPSLRNYSKSIGHLFTSHQPHGFPPHVGPSKARAMPGKRNPRSVTRPTSDSPEAPWSDA